MKHKYKTKASAIFVVSRRIVFKNALVYLVLARRKMKDFQAHSLNVWLYVLSGTSFQKIKMKRFTLDC